MLKLNYLDQRLSRGFVALYSGRIFEFIGLGLINLFLPIYLLTKFNYNPGWVFMYYLVGHFVYLILLPIGAQYINLIGLNNALRSSIFLFAGYLATINYLDVNFPLMLSLSFLLLILARLTFWLPYQVDLAIYTHKRDRGKEISIMWGTRTIIGIVMPIISGFIISKYGFNLVFLLTIVVYLSAVVPYLTLPDTQEKYSWGIRETFKKLFYKDNRKLVLANMANGAENAVGVVIWPIFIWLILRGNYFQVGAISSLIVSVTVVIQLFAGKFTDSINKRKMLKYGSLCYSVGWVAKIFVLTASQVFFIGAYHSFALILKDTPFDTLNFEILADQGHFVDEYTVLMEMAVQIGKTLVMVFAIIVAFNCGLNWTFALAAIASLLINVL